MVGESAVVQAHRVEREVSEAGGMTPRIRQAQSLGRAVDEGLISRAEAIASLVEWSHGGLTRIGAADLIDNWRSYES